MASDPLHIYSERLADRRSSLLHFKSLDERLANVRLAVFITGVTIGVFAFMGDASWWFLVPIVVGFAALLIGHDRVIRERERLERAVDFYERGMTHLQGTWRGKGRSGRRFADPSHPYAEDLDIFGPGSLFERLCSAHTTTGEECLAGWLKCAASNQVIRSRQASVAELKTMLDLREELDLLAGVTKKKMDPGNLTRWSSASIEVLPEVLRWIWLAIGVCTAVCAVAWLAGMSILPMMIAAGVGQLLRAIYRKPISDAIKGLDRAVLELTALEPALSVLVTHRFHSPDLAALSTRAHCKVGETAPEVIKRLQTLEGYLQMRGNIITGPLMEILLATPILAALIGEWRKRHGGHVQTWMVAVGEFEALSSLAAYAYENPDDPFPDLLDGGPVFAADGIAHPLLDVVVRNDIALNGDRRLFVVSGSNMSGKSTLLRAIGTNAVLAFCGAPVRAIRMEITSIQIGASIRTQDSLQEGVSRFYAEILRLRTIVQLASAPGSTLFLLDEVLHGTNSNDRHIGAEGVVGALLKHGAIGLLTTHDLALARIADNPDAKASNVHFEDTILDGKMSFDYCLRSGVVERSNALELMRAVGLEV